MTSIKSNFWGAREHFKNFPWECSKYCVKFIMRMFPRDIGRILDVGMTRIKQNVIITQFVSLLVIAIVATISRNSEVFLISWFISRKIFVLCEFLIMWLSKFVKKNEVWVGAPIFYVSKIIKTLVVLIVLVILVVAKGIGRSHDRVRCIWWGMWCECHRK